MDADATLLFQGELFADYHQFYLQDTGSRSDASRLWSDEDVEARIVTAPGFLAVSTARNMDVPVRVELHRAPVSPPADADHAVEAAITSSGEIAIAGNSDYFPTAARFQAPVGPLRVLVVFTGLGTLSEDGLDGDDRYELHMWPGEPLAAPIVHRQWREE